MPPVALTESQVVILYFFRISIVSFNKVTSEILVNYEVKTSSGVTEALFVIVLEYITIPKNDTKHHCFVNFVYHRHFHKDDIKLCVNVSNSTPTTHQ